MKLFIGCDHGGFKRKLEVISHLKSQKYEVIDLGVFSEERSDYPDQADLVCEKVLTNPSSFGILICGSGQGMCMRANRYPKIRAGIPYSLETAELLRAHNDANVICLGGRTLTLELTLKMLDLFLKTPFEGGRHLHRIQKLGNI